jgi:cation transport regulator
MPYASTTELPPAIRDHLPVSAQEVFVAAFNAAWTSYRGRDPEERERRAFRIAWAAVKRSYEKLAGRWVPKEPAI